VLWVFCFFDIYFYFIFVFAFVFFFFSVFWLFFLVFYLAFGIKNAIVFSSPEAVFLFGGLAQAGDLLFKPVQKYVDMNAMPIFKGTVKILPSVVPESNAAVLGSAALAWFRLGKK
jgi:predicted NBD/HSP70 family sugar kinase